MTARMATGLAITNPLVKYRSLIATKIISPDPAQHRLALHLQKLYDRLIDYEPQAEYSDRLDRIQKALWAQNGASNRNNRPTPQTWRSLLGIEKQESMALTRQLTSHESAMQISSPKGLMLHGEVGTGKSMLIDLFAECLPNRMKRRWHFNTFMLEAFARLEALRRQRSQSQASAMLIDGDEHSLLWLARDMIQTSPILFLDEFQLPDRTASKILTQLMTSFFHLGGVLIATSNRMPEELAKASGIEYTPPPGRLASLGWQFGLRRKLRGRSEGLFGGQSEFAAFLDVLRARCDVWEMEGGQDYRRLENGSTACILNDAENDDWQVDGHDDLQSAPGQFGIKTTEDEAGDSHASPGLPPNYIIEKQYLDSAVKKVFNLNSSDVVGWHPSALRIYGRTIHVPRTHSGVTSWSFGELCKTTLGPADYTSLASTYHTLILTDVPIMTLLMKNEARRFITLLDALYECRCKLLVTAEAGPDDIFFPEKTKTPGDGEVPDDAVYSETLSEVYQDVTAPFRPNILTQNPNYAEPDPEPDYTHARLAGLLNADALEDELERGPIDPDEPRYTNSRPDFSKTGVFTGEDERFAYKRAQSRLWEMCGTRWWARDEPDWHRPLPVEVRRWERPSSGLEPDDTSVLPPTGVISASRRSSDAIMGGAVVDNTRDERSFKDAESSTSPFRTSSDPPPKLGWQHVWGTIKWGRKAGAWGQGIEGLKDRGSEKR
ncbi:hypothetical protein K431DRAFT_221931 [Polychaeton citri CBS 116435]|uniref:AAA+ ATPase domain-containing protein n=1 Tax=Polychaeton citri CBS 116435 TaxID=1314669 RepID=A0A9P4URC3_9PEZI|nr:hypothetical protein K431DRAFT_221931 [Polychaeton citri CBS 116435]